MMSPPYPASSLASDLFRRAWFPADLRALVRARFHADARDGIDALNAAVDTMGLDAVLGDLEGLEPARRLVAMVGAPAEDDTRRLIRRYLRERDAFATPVCLR